MLHSVRLAVLCGVRAVERFFDQCFGASANPLRHLGALGFLLFWIIVASGVYLYALFDTSVAGAYRSIDDLSHGPWYFNGEVRSLHRYASDGFMLVMALHVLRELTYGRAKGFRWFSWVSGVPVIWLAFAAGIGGFWLVWDRLAQFSAIATMEWLDQLRLFGDPLTRNFLWTGSVNDRLFSLFVFLHIGVPLLLLLGLWIHIQRISRPHTMPSRALTLGTALSLLVLSLAAPIQSLPPADLSRAAASLPLDWFYLAPHALMYSTSPATLWWLAGALTILLVTMPWWTRSVPQPIAQVDAANCNGCQRCVADCPYAAISMAPINPVNPRSAIAVVDAELCASCGICAGACPSSTPFRSTSNLMTGIDMPQLPIGQLRARLKAQLARLSGTVKIVVFGCDHAVDVRTLQRADTAALSLLCTGQLPPAFVEYALRHGADGVLVTGCGECDCEFRLGNTWTEQRLEREREPHLRASVAPSRLRVLWAQRNRVDEVAGELNALRSALTLRTDRDTRYA